MIKQFSFLLVFISLYHPVSASIDDKELHLVVGSTRVPGRVIGYSLQIRGLGTDFSHTQTFGGKAVSLDIYPSKQPELPHIQADARTFKPKPGQVIKEVFMELFPSTETADVGSSITGASYFSTGMDTEASFQKLAYMAIAISNLSKYMPKGATMLIEHDPHIELMPDLNGYLSLMPAIKKANPFCCSDSIYFMDYIASAYMMPIDRQLFWQQRFQDMEARGENTNYIRHYANDINSHEKRTVLVLALKHVASCLDKNPQDILSILKTEHTTYAPNPMKYIATSLGVSLSTSLLQWYAVYIQAPLITNYLQEQGFGAVTIEIVDNNPLNGRKNCWMISTEKAE